MPTFVVNSVHKLGSNVSTDCKVKVFRVQRIYQGFISLNQQFGRYISSCVGKIYRNMYRVKYTCR